MSTVSVSVLKSPLSSDNQRMSRWALQERIFGTGKKSGKCNLPLATAWHPVTRLWETAKLITSLVFSNIQLVFEGNNYSIYISFKSPKSNGTRSQYCTLGEIMPDFSYHVQIKRRSLLRIFLVRASSAICSCLPDRTRRFELWSVIYWGKPDLRHSTCGRSPSASRKAKQDWALSLCEALKS